MPWPTTYSGVGCVLFHVDELGYVRAFFYVAADFYFNEVGQFPHGFERVELKADFVLGLGERFFYRMKEADKADGYGEPEEVYGKAVAKLVHYFFEEMFDGLYRLVYAAFVAAPVLHGRAYCLDAYGLFLCVSGNESAFPSLQMVGVELRLYLVHLFFCFVDCGHFYPLFMPL